MDVNKAAKASNALVAVTDFYGNTVGDLARQLAEARSAVALLTEHTKAQALEVTAQTDRLLVLSAAVHAVLLADDAHPPRMHEELRKAYEQAIGPVAAAPAAVPGGPPRKPAARRRK